MTPKRREPRTEAVEEPRAAAPVGSDQGPTAQQDSTGGQSEAAMFDLVLRSNRDELRQQLQSTIGNLDATATFEDGLTALSAYMMFVCCFTLRTT